MKIEKWVKEESETVAERGKVTKTKRKSEVVKLKKIAIRQDLKTVKRKKQNTVTGRRSETVASAGKWDK